MNDDMIPWEPPHIEVHKYGVDLALSNEGMLPEIDDSEYIEGELLDEEFGVVDYESENTWGAMITEPERQMNGGLVGETMTDLFRRAQHAALHGYGVEMAYFEWDRSTMAYYFKMRFKRGFRNPKGRV